ncbi:hypothetical protein HS1genome_1161 [Sulfodiicoccus acidiphilus]|uniref:Uncharacterized protein n=1 Tax=Sulfodiicoccus acidiphilus TaxID=1670455 RepID=A0A348B3M0_9CREN|nr:hypothetical protein [Sulfodiicoccus acidiphilus]BBD72772.1 hypothetical protein HS1genome_1161 [Sulfodiicoccus acidiphilus]GGT99683.1 hypothetical protein GCM10007116_16330 [Sulfodiicoccus acidiphilus]
MLLLVPKVAKGTGVETLAVAPIASRRDYVLCISFRGNKGSPFFVALLDRTGSVPRDHGSLVRGIRVLVEAQGVSEDLEKLRQVIWRSYVTPQRKIPLLTNVEVLGSVKELVEITKAVKGLISLEVKELV